MSVGSRSRRRLGGVLLAVGLCLLGFTLVGVVSELITEEDAFEGGLEPLLAIWWLLVPVGLVLAIVGASVLFSRRDGGVPADRSSIQPPESEKPRPS